MNTQADPRLGYVYDAPIHYVVMNNGENTWDMDSIERLENVYKEIEQTTGSGVVVTIGTHPKTFATGFNLQYWLAD